MHKGARGYLGVGKMMKGLPGKHNYRNVFLGAKETPVSIERPKPGLVAIGIRGLRGADGLLCPAWGTPEPGRGMVTERDIEHPTNRWFEQIRVAGGFQLRYHLKPSLYLGISEDGHPTLSETPVVWQEPADFATTSMHLWSF
jgi:hypothetical protein